VTAAIVARFAFAHPAARRLKADAHIVGLEEANPHDQPPKRKCPESSSPGAILIFQYPND
jgi:hypothetical protein